MKFNFFDISLRTVEEEDSEFIIQLRIDSKRSRYISTTSSSVNDQKNWIKEYKTRELNNEELYFIAADKDGIDFGLYRIYKIKTGLPEIGSWVIKPDYPHIKNSIKLDIGIKNFVFNHLGFDELQFEVRKNNLSVIKYHQLFGVERVKEDDLNYYYIMMKNQFQHNKIKLLNKFKITAL